jgi:hypothetical protein
MSTGLGREDIRALLDDLSAELAARGARAELFLVGGAALAVAYDATRATRDLDAVFIPTDVVRQAARAVAEHRGLTEDWLNDAVKGFLPGPDPDAQRFYGRAQQNRDHRDSRADQGVDDALAPVTGSSAPDQEHQQRADRYLHLRMRRPYQVFGCGASSAPADRRHPELGSSGAVWVGA